MLDPYGSNPYDRNQYLFTLQQASLQAPLQSSLQAYSNQEFVYQKKQENSNKKLLLLEDTI